MTSVKWIKINVDMFDDEKIKIIQAMPEGDSLLVVWIKLITLAGKTNNGGYVYMSDNIPYTEEMLSTIMNKPLNIIKLALQTFIHLGMIENDERGIYLINFEKHQSLDKLEQIKEQTRLRVAKYRAKLKQNNDVTLQVTQSNAIDIDIDKELDKDIYILYENEIGELNSKKYEELNNLIDKYGKDKVTDAINISIKNNKKSFEYIKAILNNGIYKKKEKETPEWLNKENKSELIDPDELEELNKEFEMFE